MKKSMMLECFTKIMKLKELWIVMEKTDKTDANAREFYFTRRFMYEDENTCADRGNEFDCCGM